MHITIRVLLCILKGFLLCQTFVGYNSKVLKKMSLNVRPWNFQYLRNQQNQGRYPYNTYLSILIKNLTEKKVIIHFFRKNEKHIKDTSRLHQSWLQTVTYFKFHNDYDLKGELLSWTTAVVLTKVCSFSKEIAKAITLSNNNNNNNNSIKQTLEIPTLKKMLNKMKKIKQILYPALRCTGIFQSKVSY